MLQSDDWTKQLCLFKRLSISMLDTSWNWGKTKWIWELGQVTGSRQLDMLDCTLRSSRNTSFHQDINQNRIYFYSILSSWMLEHSNAETIKTSWRCSDKVQESKLLPIATNIPPSSQKKSPCGNPSSLSSCLWLLVFHRPNQWVHIELDLQFQVPKSPGWWVEMSLSRYGETGLFFRFFQVMSGSTEHPHRIHVQQNKRTSRQSGFLY